MYQNRHQLSNTCVSLTKYVSPASLNCTHEHHRIMSNTQRLNQYCHLCLKSLIIVTFPCAFNITDRNIRSSKHKGIPPSPHLASSTPPPLTRLSSRYPPIRHLCLRLLFHLQQGSKFDQDPILHLEELFHLSKR